MRQRDCNSAQTSLESKEDPCFEMNSTQPLGACDHREKQWCKQRTAHLCPFSMFS